MGFEVIPAIDLRGGRCVRLYQGDFAKETVFSNDPVGVARRWEAAGAPRIHVVDLDGAASGRPVNTSIVEAIAGAVSIPIQVGGGLRTIEAIELLLARGAQRVVLGTSAAEDPALVGEAAQRFGEAIVVGVDARDGLVATHGWVKAQAISAVDLIKRMEALDVRRFVYTDIARDGALTGPAVDSIGDLLASTGAAIIASGGVSSLADLEQLAGLGIEGAIVGRAVYTGDVDLRRAVAMAETWDRRD
ncbi:MAG: 1-(5-phosphoribosyl)-5-[(5-phosphoribosylamino)methylideneamino]imidazole-4-carboxamide isomerase [Chloroflexi bacterium]|nr:1-(5-phosphoribosyl)-5-[(5-phosphoribosylamino)methylideneamino]imidazole-4-carboxamide isomerase [Chloroflexota bacterium]MCH8195180.1 1-(5-phosphoribosyl)-5-[(5-phosphoribosylamino)methylideneamino]imidazole-4-carboxamide isomerase [Chloroflexota bacterium]MCI0769497.1 1-(5-phosphoribosyl)-5-[(5-phosphoribosylamino)methylideneamino]imidazole-4-carboxamide isomerase [Chloroflexota bacterium]